ncbi:MAG TPA: CHAT domain-containing tetratricopeptide repeat protein [Chloroflexota bacterium]|nr:CHAT domain-containing tetratricopeptide repeat protein [Chloroflexota bacterium]
MAAKRQPARVTHGERGIHSRIRSSAQHDRVRRPLDCVGRVRLRQMACLLLTTLVLVTVHPGSASAASTAVLPRPHPSSVLPQDRPGEETGDARLEGLLREGIARRDAGDLSGAVDYFQQALDLVRQRGERTAEQALLRALGGIYWRMEQYDQAAETYLQALDLARELNDRRAEGVIFADMADLAMELQQCDVALNGYRAALTIAEDLSDRPAERQAAYQVGMAYRCLGRYAENVAHWERALALAQELRQEPNVLLTLDNLGQLHLEYGRNEQALLTFGQLIPLARGHDDRVTEVDGLLGLATANRQLGRYGQARELLERASAAVNGLGDQGSAYETLARYRVAHELGALYRQLGQYATALSHYEQAVTLAYEIPGTAGYGYQMQADLHLGMLLLEMRQPERAAGFYERGMRMADRLFTSRLSGMERAVLLGELLPAVETLVDNLEVLQPALTGTEHFDTLLTILQRWIDQGSASADLRNSPAVRLSLLSIVSAMLRLSNQVEEIAAISDDTLSKFSAEAVTLAREVGDRDAELRNLRRLGEFYERAGQLDSALDYYREAIAAWEDVRAAARVEDFRAAVAERAAETYQRAARVALHLDRPHEAFDLSERGRARTFLDQLGNARLAPASTPASPAFERVQALRAEIGALDIQLRSLRGQSASPDASADQTLAAELDARQRDYEEALTRLRIESPEAASLVSVDPLPLPAVQAALDGDTTLLSYFVTETETLVFVVGRDSFRAAKLPVGAAELRTAIEAFRTFDNPADVRPASLDQLAGWLLAPIRDQLTTRTVAIVPHGILHYLPFAALPDGTGNFGDRHTLFTLPSASTLPLFLAKRQGPARHVLALAQREAPGLPMLRFVDVEAEHVAALYGDQARTGRAATLAALQAPAEGPRVLHLVAHGELNPVRPLFSRLYLANDATHDGILDVATVYGLDLRGTDLVVLSACETTLGPQSRGDDLIGLSRAFLAAGAPTVIASLWTVPDEATATLMAAFYAHLRAGANKAAALQAAQAAVRAQYPHPYFWAGFILTGDPGVPAQAVAPPAVPPPPAGPALTENEPRGLNPGLPGMGGRPNEPRGHEEPRGLNPGLPGMGSVLAARGESHPPAVAAWAGEAHLAAASASDAAGWATLLVGGGRATVEVQLAGLPSGVTLEGSLRAGSCSGAVRGQLGTVQPDGAGRASATSSVPMPAEATTWWIVYQPSGGPTGAPVLCGPITL